MTEFALEGVSGEFVDLARRAGRNGEVVYLADRGMRIDAIVPSEMAEEIEAAEDREDPEAARAAMAEPGESIPWERLRAELNL